MERRWGRAHPIFRNLIEGLVCQTNQTVLWNLWMDAGCPVVEEEPWWEGEKAPSVEAAMRDWPRLRKELEVARERIRELEHRITVLQLPWEVQKIRNDALEEALTEMGRCFSVGLSYERIATRIRALKK